MPLTFGEPFPGLIEASASVISIFRLITFLTLATKYGVHSQREEGGQRERVRCLHLLSDKHVTTLHKFVANASNKEYFEKKEKIYCVVEQFMFPLKKNVVTQQCAAWVCTM